MSADNPTLTVPSSRPDHSPMRTGNGPGARQLKAILVICQRAGHHWQRTEHLDGGCDYEHNYDRRNTTYHPAGIEELMNDRAYGHLAEWIEALHWAQLRDADILQRALRGEPAWMPRQ